MRVVSNISGDDFKASCALRDRCHKHIAEPIELAGGGTWV